MRLPSVRTIRDILRCEQDVAKAVRERLETWRDSKREAPVQALLAINTLLVGHGVEYIRSRQDTFREARGVHYVNMGDPYKPTVYFDYRDLRFYVGSWGDLVETHDHRFGE